MTKTKFKTRLYAFVLVVSLILLLPLPLHAQQEPLTIEDLGVTTSKNMYVIDADTNQVLLDVKGEEKIYVASLTKMMSELLAIEHFDNLNETITITNDMLDGLKAKNASVVGFQVDDEVSIEDLLYGAALPSGADAVNALAVATSGSIDAFVEDMNKRAQELGMDSTSFKNPTGLHEEGHYSSCKDIAKLMQECLKHPIFLELIKQETYTTSPVKSNDNGIEMQSTVWKYATNQNDGKRIVIDGFVGGKTGYTIPAGRCLASYISINNMNLISVMCGSNETGHFLDTANVVTRINKAFQRLHIGSKGDVIKRVKVLHTFPEKTINLVLEQDVDLDLPTNGSYMIQTNVPDTIDAPLQKGQQIGTWYLEANNEVLYEEAILAQEDVPSSILSWPLILGIFFFTICLIIILLIARKKRIQKIRRQRRIEARRRQQRKNTDH